MNQFSKKGFQISVLLHALFFVGIGFAFLLSQCSSKPRSHHVFLLEASPGKQGINAIKTAPKKPDAPTPIKPAKPELEKMLASVPQSSQVPKAASPTPETPPKVSTIPKPVVVQKAKQEAKMSYEDFVKAQGKPISKEVKTVAVQAVAAPKIQTPDLKKNFEQRLSSIETLNSITEGSGGVVAEYQDYVRSMIDSSWEQPKDFSGYNNGALFEFDIDKFGRIYNVRVVKSSGSRIFDESVQQAFVRVGEVKATPNGRALAGCRLTFTKKGKGSN